MGNLQKVRAPLSKQALDAFKKGAFPFLDLPREIRDEIYEQTWVAERLPSTNAELDVRSDAIRKQWVTIDKKVQGLGGYNILFANKQVSEEAIPVIYAMAVPQLSLCVGFALRYWPDISFACRGGSGCDCPECHPERGLGNTEWVPMLQRLNKCVAIKLHVRQLILKITDGRRPQDHVYNNVMPQEEDECFQATNAIVQALVEFKYLARVHIDVTVLHPPRDFIALIRFLQLSKKDISITFHNPHKKVPPEVYFEKARGGWAKLWRESLDNLTKSGEAPTSATFNFAGEDASYPMLNKTSAAAKSTIST
jgi:hypothetical protein